MKRRTKVLISIPISMLSLFLLATYPVVFDPNEKDIRERVFETIRVELPDEFTITESEAWEAPVYQIQGIIYGEDVTVQLVEIDYFKKKKEIMEKRKIRSSEEIYLDFEVPHDHGKIYYRMNDEERTLSYHYSES